ncbi:MAG: hypothetical protein IPL61_24605 [Myxococcales bacterium]|nr:hypothetical protein [Myxococcales bacterium]
MEPAPLPVAIANAAAGAPAPPKMAIDRFADGDIVCLKLAGTIDEAFEGKRLAESVRAGTLILDLGDIRKVSSFGIREWVDFVNGVGKTAQRILLVECAPKIVDQFNMVANFAGTGRVYSFYAPYHCDYCDRDDRVLLQVDRDHELIKSMKPAQRACSSCGEMQYFNEDPVTYFSYLAGQDKFELDPDIAGFLASKLSYAIADGARKLRVDKTIEGRVTFIKLAGDLDKTFPRDKLAEGLEGAIVIDVGGVGKIEPAGAAEWRGLIQQVTPIVEAIYLTAVPLGFLDKLTRPEDLGPKAVVASFTLPYTCSKCSTTAGQLIDVDTHFEVLKFATPPDLKCHDCKGPLACAAPEGLLANLAKLPKPNVSVDLAKLIREVRDRKPQAKKVATTVAEAAMAQRGGGLGVAFVAALATVVLAAGAFAAYKMFGGGDHAAPGRGKLTGTSAEARPAWITTDAPLAATCADEAGGLRCVGVSGLAPTSDDAIAEAGDAALDGLAVALDGKITDAAWRTQVAGQYREARAAKLAAAERDARSAQARRVVRDARSGVARALRASGAFAAPPEGYWEEYTGGAGKQFVGFASLTITADALAKLATTYQTPTTVAGVTAVASFPLISWRYPEVTRGAIITAIDPNASALAGSGLTPGYVVLSVAGAKVADAAGFAQLATDELARLKTAGGALRFEVQTGDGDSKSFTVPVAADKPVDTGRSGSGSGGGSSRGSGGTGNVNVWDRYGGGSGAGRDDPTQ